MDSFLLGRIAVLLPQKESDSYLYPALCCHDQPITLFFVQRRVFCSRAPSNNERMTKRESVCACVERKKKGEEDVTYIAHTCVFVHSKVHLAKGALANDALQDVLLQLRESVLVLGQGRVQGLADLDFGRLHGASSRRGRVGSGGRGKG